MRDKFSFTWMKYIHSNVADSGLIVVADWVHYVLKLHIRPYRGLRHGILREPKALRL